ncbi:hypothetical protein MIND_00349700 [Mycena indigotica]|uniref:Uncharacterized protein n=1 Tax=Mycena indigotica TaxID=2126181 RepID=A0A8H6T166_9AGAR|nr:uncharacterized protein MIND_00349700 [Mycena indigotica]KAF7309778.1 hypothetical protein MIND_00349700 [Mycena indigotica]
MSNLGTVFLGDNRRRVFSSTASNSTGTPPSSPPPTSMSSSFNPASIVTPALSSPKPPTPAIDPALSLELRLRWLEAILVGVKQQDTRKGKEREGLGRGETLLRAAENLQKRLNTIVTANDGLKRFMEHYDQHAHLLTPSFAHSEDQPTYENMTSAELEAFLVEMEPDIRAADRDMQEIEELEKKGVTGAGKLAEYEHLRPRLDALLSAHEEDVERATALEKRVAKLMEDHATQVDALSELFVVWDDTLVEAEDKILAFERDRQDRRRLGLT